MNRLILLAAFLLFFSNHLVAQNKISIGITSLLGKSDLIQYEPLDGASSFDGRDQFSVGIRADKQLKRNLSFNASLMFSKHTMVRIPNLPPGIDFVAEKNSFNQVYLATQFNVTFLKYLFISAGPVFDIYSSNTDIFESQTGIGLSVNLGAKATIANKFTLFAGPGLVQHSIISFSTERYPFKLAETGLSFGVLYRL